MNQSAHFVTAFVDRWGRCAISPDEHRDILANKNYLTTMMMVEESFAMIFENLVELEVEIARICIRQMVYSDFDRNSIDDHRLTAETKLLNMLATIRAYFDRSDRLFVKQHRDIFDFGPARSSRFDRFQEYRVMEALRNLSQHKAPGLSRITLHHQSQEFGSRKRLVYGLSFRINDEILLDEKFQRHDEGHAGGFDLMTTLRSYISHITNIHREFREANRSKLDRTKAHFQKTMEELSARMGFQQEVASVEVYTGGNSHAVRDGSYFAEQFERLTYLARISGHPRYQDALFMTEIIPQT